MNLPYTIEGCPYTSQKGIRVLRGGSAESTYPEDPSLCDVLKIQYAIELEQRAVAAEAKVTNLERERDHANDTASAVLKENTALEAKVKRLEEELADYMTLYTDWKAYATNLESAGDYMLKAGFHSPVAKSAWTQAKETRP